VSKFPFYKQLDQKDCGATCVRMVAKFHGRAYSLEYLREQSFVDREGVSISGITSAAESIGLHSLVVKLPYDRLLEGLPLPFVVHWRQKHFIVVYKINKNYVWAADPGVGLIKYSRAEFLNGWASDVIDGVEEGVIVLMETTPDFHKKENESVNRKGWKYLSAYLFKYKRLLFQLVLGLLTGSLLQLVFPFLMQSLVDFGIQNRDIDFIYLILVAQLVLFASQSVVEAIRSWILMHVGTRVNINLIADFLSKIMSLPLSFFDSKMTTDLFQRIGDHRKVEQFLTSTSLATLFSFFTFLAFSAVLLFYDRPVFYVFLAGSILYFLWSYYFLKKRKLLDYKRFDKLNENQSALVELIHGMPEIKLHGAERQKRWAWERIQAKLFGLSMDSLKWQQWQKLGAKFINETKNILITFLAAKGVVDGTLSLGQLLAIQYILGQVNGAIVQFMDFVRSAQEAKLSLERLGEIHDKDNEFEQGVDKAIIPNEADIQIDKLSFKYGNNALVLEDINLFIPKGKVSAIVGTSGSGKTTLLKLLLGFYKPTSGEIRLGQTNLATISKHDWRNKCGAVMQNGYIFSDTIANNITLGDENMDKSKLQRATKLANINPFIESLPLAYNTVVGNNGIGLSQGQQQRLLIARAIYKDPEYLFFDEATNALDSFNELLIMENLRDYYKGRTVVVVAHRLSTVKDADNIIVLDEGEVVEQGNHDWLIRQRGAYYHLVKNQLELGA